MIALALSLLLTKQTVCFVNASDEKKPIDAVCPVDGTKFTAFEVKSNRFGGQDTDFCVHALKTTPMELWIWVCPTCRFAGQPADFKLVLSSDEKTALLADLKPAIEVRKGAKQTDVPGHVKYDLVAQVARIRKAPPERLGLAWLHASWCARQQGAVNFEDFVEWDKIRETYELDKEPIKLGLKKNRTEFDLEAVKKIEKDIEAKKYEKSPNRILSRYLAAYTWRKHGENVEALRWLSEVDAMKGENSIVDDAAARMRASIELERSYQKKAIDAYVEAIDSKKHSKRLSAETAYVIGELFRRLGQADSAASWYQTAIDTSEADDLKKLAGDQKSKLPK